MRCHSLGVASISIWELLLGSLDLATNTEFYQTNVRLPVWLTFLARLKERNMVECCRAYEHVKPTFPSTHATAVLVLLSAKAVPYLFPFRGWQHGGDYS